MVLNHMKMRKTKVVLWCQRYDLKIVFGVEKFEKLKKPQILFQV